VLICVCTALYVCVCAAPTREPTPAFEVPAVDVSTANTATVPTAPVDASLVRLTALASTMHTYTHTHVCKVRSPIQSCLRDVVSCYVRRTML